MKHASPTVRRPRASPVGRLVKQWRERRRLSQLSLAVDAEISTRHLSFIETGRSQPSREMVLLLARALDVPPRGRNDLLAAAGYAPVYRETALDAPQMADVKRALDFTLRQQEPFPALVVDGLEPPDEQPGRAAAHGSLRLRGGRGRGAGPAERDAALLPPARHAPLHRQLGGHRRRADPVAASRPGPWHRRRRDAPAARGAARLPRRAPEVASPRPRHRAGALPGGGDAQGRLPREVLLHPTTSRSTSCGWSASSPPTPRARRGCAASRPRRVGRAR